MIKNYCVGFKVGDCIVCVVAQLPLKGDGRKYRVVDTRDSPDGETGQLVMLDCVAGWWSAARFVLASTPLPAQILSTAASMRATAEAMIASDIDEVRQQGLELRRAAATAEGWAAGIEKGEGA